MKQGVLLLMMLFLLTACRHTSKQEVMKGIMDNGLLQYKEQNGFKFRLQYMPPGKGTESSLLRFRLNITGEEPIQHTDAGVFSFGLDTLFHFVNVKDTSAPIDVMRIANGNIGGLEYMLIFERPQGYSAFNCNVVFNDWLFTHQVLTFPIDGAAIKHIDSLSLNL